MASIFDIDISEEKSTKYPDAVELFTDRENPQEAFERKLRVISDHRKNAFAVLCYYGIGGVGKTSLKDRLCRVIDGVPGNPRRVYEDMHCDYVSYDFNEDGATNDKLSILSKLSRQIQNLNKGYRFYLFETALVMYAKRTGAEINVDKKTSVILDRNPWLNSMVTTLGVLPVVSWTSNALQALDTFAAAASNKWTESRNQKIYADELSRICTYQKSDLLKYLHEWFIIDMRTNMQLSDCPLVIFLDTYEKYVDSMYNAQASEEDDKWLRDGKDSLIRSVPGVLWVVMSRERLNWDRNDKFWECGIPERPLDEMSEEEKEKLSYEVMEQHLLGKLSRNDAMDYLKRAGMEDADLAGAIYDKLTGGIPLSLDICIREYRKIKETKIPELSDFGGNMDELVTRYVRGLSDADKEIAYMLSIIGSWDDELVEGIVPGIRELRYFTKKRYSEFCKHSFVIHEANGTSYIHETVRKTCLIEADEEIVEGTTRELNNWNKKKLVNDTDLDYTETASKYIHNLFSTAPTFEQIHAEVGEISTMLNSVIMNKGDVEGGFRLSQIIYDNITSLFKGTSLEMHASIWMSEAVIAIGRFGDAIQYVEKYLHTVSYTCPDNMDAGEYYVCLGRIGRIVEYDEQLKKAKTILEIAYKALKENPEYGPDNYETLRVYKELGKVLTALESCEEALVIFRYVYEKYSQMLGEEHIDTLTIMHNIARCLEVLENYDEALEIAQKAYELSVKVLGEKHFTTIGAYKRIGLIYDSLGRKEEAFEIDKYVFECNKEILGEDHPNTLNAAATLAYDYIDIGDEETALQLREYVYEKRRNALGDGSPTTLKTARLLSDMYYEADRYEEAIEILLRSYEYAPEIHGKDSKQMAAITQKLALCYYFKSQFAEALKYAEEDYAIRKKTPDIEDNAYLNSLNLLGKLYYQLDDEARAYEMYELEYKARSKNENRYTDNRLFRRLMNTYVAMAKCKYYTKEYETSVRILEDAKELTKDRDVPKTLIIDMYLFLARNYEKQNLIRKSLETYRYLLPLVEEDYSETDKLTITVKKNIESLRFKDNKKFW